MMVALASLAMGVMAEEGPSVIGVSMAATLIGSISFIMCLYYFINYDDEDIKEMAWQTINVTISIFCAVLFFSSFNDLAEAYVIDPIFGENKLGALGVDFVHMLLWFSIMQYSLAILSGAAGPNSIDIEAFEKLDEEEQEEIKESKEVDMACYAVLCAHITGFASINAFGTLQMVFFSSSPGMAMLTPLIALIFMLFLQRITDEIRTKISMGDDGEMDEFEKMWDEECEEAENDVMGLALSFTMLNALRFWISGCLPNEEGKEEECPKTVPEEYLYHHTTYQKAMMISLGVAFALIIFVMRSNWPEWLEPEAIRKMPKSQRSAMKLKSRLAEGIYVAISMCFSWSLFFGCQMILAGFTIFHEPELLAVTLAIGLSLSCMLGIIPLDKLADADWTDEHADTAIRSIMSAMGLLIGFGWEQCFDASVDALAQKADDCEFALVNPHTAKLALTLFCSGLLIPAWKWYILPFIVAKGWTASYPLQLNAKLIKAMEKEEEEEGKEGKKMSEEVRDKIVAHMEKQALQMSSVASKKGKVAPKEGAESTTPYVALGGEETVAGLKKQVAALQKELAEAKGASVQAQTMLDNTMESMLSSMKQMHQTVARIESTA